MKQNKQKLYLKADAIFKYLTGEDNLHTLITTQNTEVELITTDQSLYEALGSVNRDEIDVNLLVKLLEVTTIGSRLHICQNMEQKQKIFLAGEKEYKK